MIFMIKIKKARKVTGDTLKCTLGMLNIMKKTEMQSDGERIKHELVNDSQVDILYLAKFNNDV